MERLANLISFKVSNGTWKGIKASRGGPTVSHLFFADDIILFAEATEAMGRTVIDTLEEFCDVSGQTINRQKSHLFVSPNVPRRRALALSFCTHIPLTKDLGKYLGVPLMHKRLNAAVCNDVLERTKKRLGGWKTKLLNLAARVTLVKHVTSSLPVHVMQTMPLPVGVCKSLDQINRNFIWGDTDASKKIHLVGWDKICKPKKWGGLGIRRAKDNNAAMISKLGWKLVKGDDAPWAQIMKAKYMRYKPMKGEFFKRKGRVSHVWRGIMNTSDIVVKGTKWRIGNGQNVSFWKDWWCGDSKLGNFTRSCRINTDNNLNVASFMDVITGWNKELLKHVLNDKGVDVVMATPCPTLAVDHIDTPFWGLASNGKFTVKSAMDDIISLSHIPAHYDSFWNLLWSRKLPNKVKYFIWLVSHNSILTNRVRAIRQLTTSALCERCMISDETTCHVLRDCRKAKAVWDGIVGLNPSPSLNPTLDIREWLQVNLENDTFVNGTPWYVIFCATVWNIWISRNKEVISGMTSEPLFIANQSMRFANEISIAFELDKGHGTLINSVKMVNWKFPNAGKLKINCDASVHLALGKASFGGIARDDSGKWILGFYGFIGNAKITEAELWSIHQGLIIAKDRGWKNLIVESDSQVALNLIKNGDIKDHPLGVMIDECRRLLDFVEGDIQHTWREGNSCVDMLANVGGQQSESLVILDDPIACIKDLIFADIIGVCFPRL